MILSIWSMVWGFKLGGIQMKKLIEEYLIIETKENSSTHMGVGIINGVRLSVPLWALIIGMYFFITRILM